MFAAVQKAILANNVSLPSMPEVAHYLQSQMETPQFDLTKLVRLVEKDPALAACVLRVAKSPLYRSIHPVESVRDAVLRVGLLATRAIAFSQFRQSLFSSKQKVVSINMDAIWARSIHVAAIASVIAKRYRITSPERAMIGGLLHDIGSMLLLSYLDQSVTFPEHVEDLEQLLQLHSAGVGVTLLAHWKMDPELIDVAQNRHNWHRQSHTVIDLCDLVLVAVSYYFAQNGDVYERPLFHTIPAYRKLGLPQPNVGDTVAVLSAAAGDIEEIRTALAA